MTQAAQADDAVRAPDGKIVWQPIAGTSQSWAFKCPITEIHYEGNRGPGKTDWLLMMFARHVGRGFGAYWRGTLFRREYGDLDEIVAKSKRFFYQAFPGAVFLESRGAYTWKFPTGERLSLRAVKKPDDYWKHHGGESPYVAFDEKTTWPNLDLYDDLKSINRSTFENKPGLVMPRYYLSTSNPYGRGHNVVKKRFITPAPAGRVIDDKYGKRVRIHGDMRENPFLLRNDPGYLKTLKSATARNPNKAKAWLRGSWDIVAGGIFDATWNDDVHVLKPFEIPKGWYIDRSFDWGKSKPFSVGWWAESDGTAALIDGVERTFPRGTLIRIGEWYGCTDESNVGLGLSDSNIAKGIKQRQSKQSYGKRVAAGPADSSIFDEVNGDSPALQQLAQGIRWLKSDKSPGSRKRGWSLLIDRLEASLQQPMEEPGLYVTDNCRALIELLPAAPADESDPDDVDTEYEDHPLDETRYRVLHKRKETKRVSVRYG